MQYFVSLADHQVPAKHQDALAKYRGLAIEHDVAACVPLSYLVRAGFSLKNHAPLAGPCYQGFQYLQDWKFQDEPTKEGLAFWVPRPIYGCSVKNSNEQLAKLVEIGRRLRLPSHHLAGFGSASLVAGLILAHRQVTDERVPFGCKYVRTDASLDDGRRLVLGNFGKCGLDCVALDSFDQCFDVMQVFAVGFEPAA